jgi:hypothetical protein
MNFVMNCTLKVRSMIIYGKWFNVDFNVHLKASSFFRTDIHFMFMSKSNHLNIGEKRKIAMMFDNICNYANKLNKIP